MRSPSTRGTNCSGCPGTTSKWPWKTSVARSEPSGGPTAALSACRSPNLWSTTSISRASSQPLMNPAAARSPSTFDVSYVIRRSVSARSSIPPRLALGDLQKSFVATGVALRGAPLLGVLLGVVALLLGPLEAVLQVAAVEVVDLEDLVDEHQRMRAGDLQEALALRVADDVGLRLVEPQLRRVEHRQQRLMVREQADGAHAGLRGHHLDLVVEDLAVRGEDLDGEGRVRHLGLLVLAVLVLAVLVLLVLLLVLRGPLRGRDDVVDRALEEERGLGQVVVLALEHLGERAHGVGDRHVDARRPRELLRDVERLRQEALDAAGALHEHAVLVGELVDAEDRDDVLQLAVALQHLLDLVGHAEVLVAHDLRLEDR